MIDPGLRQYATDTEARYLDAVSEYGSARKAATALGAAKSTITAAIERVRKRAAQQGYSPEHGITQGVAPGYSLSGYSHLTRTEDGEPIWLKARKDKASQIQTVVDFTDRLAEGIKPLPPRPAPKGAPAEELLNQHNVTDLHFGMLAWPAEVGGAWDLKIAEQLIVDWFADSLRRSPKAAVGLLAEMGDLLHFDSLETETPASGHVLDADSRYQRVVDVVLDSMQRIIDMMLKKYPHVHVIINDGNHDPAGSVWLRGHLRKMYERNPRLSLGDGKTITIDRSPSTFNAYQWGDNLLGFHHGHKVKPERLTKVIASEFREMYGRTRFAYGNSGHLHSLKVIEDELMQWRQHPTMASRDAYSARLGYSAQRMAFTTTYHKRFGYWSEIVTTPEMVQEAA